MKPDFVFTWKKGSGPMTPNRVFCIGKNYRKHIEELADGDPGEPVVFMKPASCLVAPGTPLTLPTHGDSVHHEAELVLLVGKRGRNLAENEALSHIAGITLGIDLTLRDVQSRLKQKGLPWEMAKAFEQSAPLGALMPCAPDLDLNALEFNLQVNGSVRQQGRVGEMIHSIPQIVHFLSGVWTLTPGDLVFTGTPSGVGPLRSGDRVKIASEPIGAFEWNVL